MRTIWYIASPDGRSLRATSAEEFFQIIDMLRNEFGENCQIEISAIIEVAA